MLGTARKSRVGGACSELETAACRAGVVMRRAQCCHCGRIVLQGRRASRMLQKWARWTLVWRRSRLRKGRGRLQALADRTADRWKHNFTVDGYKETRGILRRDCLVCRTKCWAHTPRGHTHVPPRPMMSAPSIMSILIPIPGTRLERLNLPLFARSNDAAAH